MKRILLSVTVAAALAGAALGAGVPASDPIPVGAFLVEMARMLDPALPEGLALEDAVARLKEAGLQLPEDTDYGAPMTEGDVVRFASAVGVRLRSLNPDEIFPAARVSELAGVLRDGRKGSGSHVATVLGAAGEPDRDDSASDFESPSDR